jgi:hypothetical protein
MFWLLRHRSMISCRSCLFLKPRRYSLSSWLKFASFRRLNFLWTRCLFNLICFFIEKRNLRLLTFVLILLSFVYDLYVLEWLDIFRAGTFSLLSEFFFYSLVNLSFKGRLAHSWLHRCRIMSTGLMFHLENRISPRKWRIFNHKTTFSRCRRRHNFSHIFYLFAQFPHILKFILLILFCYFRRKIHVFKRLIAKRAVELFAIGVATLNFVEYICHRHTFGRYNRRNWLSTNLTPCDIHVLFQ